MAKHSNGRMNWKIADTVWSRLWEQLIWGGVGLLTVVVVIIILEVTGTSGR
ncbi:hypothetical protein [Rhodococcus sp. NPDC058521]|uniref:hypothetical protein n=1 Tax=Rhodococcus sp. NPDC058521 TaxID=3346536 RepID=UPI00364B8AFC